MQGFRIPTASQPRSDEAIIPADRRIHKCFRVFPSTGRHMRFRAHSTMSSHRSSLALLGGVLFLCVFLLLLGKCSKDPESGKQEEARTLVREKVPPRPFKADIPLMEKPPRTGKYEARSGGSPGTQESPKDTGSFYKTRAGDTLFAIAARPQVYGDGDKWPSLVRLNLSRLTIEELEGLQYKELPAGLELKYMKPGEAAAKIKDLGDGAWVVNAFSTRDEDNVAPAAVTLIRQGYRVYVSRAQVDGNEWLRVRAGFFPDRETAESEAARIATLLEDDRAWVARLEGAELKEYAGY